MIIKRINYQITIVILISLLFLVLANAILRPLRAESSITGMKRSLIDISIGDEYEQGQKRVSHPENFENKADTYEEIPHRGLAELLQAVGQVTELLDIQMSVNKIVRGIISDFSLNLYDYYTNLSDNGDGLNAHLFNLKDQIISVKSGANAYAPV